MSSTQDKCNNGSDNQEVNEPNDDEISDISLDMGSGDKVDNDNDLIGEEIDDNTQLMRTVRLVSDEVGSGISGSQYSR